VQADEYVNGSGTTTTKSVYADQGTVFADLTSGNSMQARYVRQDDSQYSPVVVRLDGSGNALWNLSDRQGSLENVVNASGTVVDTLTYDGFGNVTAESDSTKTGRFTFTGLTYQRNAGQLEANYRLYDPSVGRWRQEDPIRWQGGDVNLGRYVGNGSTNGMDPSGLQRNGEMNINLRDLRAGGGAGKGKVIWEPKPGPDGLITRVDGSNQPILKEGYGTSLKATDPKGQVQQYDPGVYLEYVGPNPQNIRWIQFVRMYYKKIVIQNNVAVWASDFDQSYQVPIKDRSGKVITTVTTSDSKADVYILDTKGSSAYYYDPAAANSFPGNVSPNSSAIFDRPNQLALLDDLMNGKVPGAANAKLVGNEIGAALILIFDSYAVDITKNNKIVAHVPWSSMSWNIPASPKLAGVNLFQFPQLSGVRYLPGGKPDDLAAENKAIKDAGFNIQITP